jgi:hypothetical protein
LKIFQNLKTKPKSENVKNLFPQPLLHSSGSLSRPRHHYILLLQNVS